MDMTAVIVPKSDQINADDLISGPMTITITDVKIRGGEEQPVSIFFEGSDKAFRPCKSMSRVLVAAWGPDARKYVGRSVTLYRDPTVKWGGMEIGGIRISHMSDIDNAMTLALTATRANRKPFTVKPLQAVARPTPAKPQPRTPVAVQTPPSEPTDIPSDITDYADAMQIEIEVARDPAALTAHFNAAIKTDEWKAMKVAMPKRAQELKEMTTRRLAELRELTSSPP